MRSNSILRSFTFLFFVLLMSVSCSVEKNRKLLSVFFDGVPLRQATTSDAGSTDPSDIKVIRRERVTFVSYHPDFKSKNCAKCHKKGFSNRLAADKKEFCFTCHPEKKFQGKYIHGPIAVKACNVCHLPHKSENPALLREKGRELCDQCHRTPLQSLPGPGKGEDCLECHTPHAASNPNFLKPSIPRDNTIHAENKDEE